MKLSSLNEIIISITIFVVSLTGSAFAYLDIRQIQQVDEVLVSEIPLGKKEFTLSNSNSCFGNIETNLKTGETSSDLESQGNLSIKIHENILNAGFSLLASFNSIGQLGRSFFKLNLGDAAISIQTENINPILVKISSEGNIIPLTYSLNIQGPFLLEKNSNQTYRLEHSGIRNFRKNSQVFMGPEMAQALAFSANDKEKKAEICSGKINYFDTNPYLGSLTTIAERFRTGFTGGNN